MLGLTLALALIVPAAARPGGAVDTCPHPPQFKALERKLAGMGPAAALATIDRYEADPEN